MNFLKRQSGSCVNGRTESSQISLKVFILGFKDYWKPYGFGTTCGWV